MRYDKVYEQLNTLNEAEQMMKEYFIQKSSFYPIEKIPYILPDMDLQWN